MFAAVQFFNPFDGQQVGADSADLCTHPDKHVAKLEQIGFAGGIEDGGFSFGHDSGHEDIGGSGDGCFIEQHIGSLQFRQLYTK